MKFKKEHVTRFDLFLSARFESLGSWIARSPGTFILFPIIFTLLMGSGLQQFKYASDVFYLFVPVNAQSIEDANVIRQLFPRNVSKYVMGSELGRQQMTEVILVPKEGFTILSSEVWKEAKSLIQSVEQIKGKLATKIFYLLSLKYDFLFSLS